MSVSVKKTDDGYEITIKGKTVTLPSDSKESEIPNEMMKIGTDKKRLEIDAHSNEIVLVEDGEEEVIVPDEGDDEERMELVSALSTAWANRDDQDGSSRRRSRVNRKTRRSKGKRRNTKRSKLRKLSSRRR
jgi:hypothetical protein